MRPEQPRSFEAMGVTVEVGGADHSAFEADPRRSSPRARPSSAASGAAVSSRASTAARRPFSRSLPSSPAPSRWPSPLPSRPRIGRPEPRSGTRGCRLRPRPSPSSVPDERPLGPPHPGSWRALAIVGGILFRAAGTKLDLNGVVKSMAVDDAVALLPGDGYVSAGGDLATRGAMDVLLPSGGTVRPSRRRDRDERVLETKLDPRRRAAAPPDRSADRPAGTVVLDRRHGRRRLVSRGRRRRAGRVHPRRGRSGMARRPRACGLVRRSRGSLGRESHVARADGLLGRGMNVAWYVARTGGILGFTLLTASAVLGVTLAGRPRLARWPRFAIEDVHRFAGMLAGVFIWLHVLVVSPGQLPQLRAH